MCASVRLCYILAESSWDDLSVEDRDMIAQLLAQTEIGARRCLEDLNDASG
jgi:hypothetical protein